MEFRNKDDVDRVLAALGETLAASKGPPIDLLVCGGSALNALGLVTRPTKDVDVLALVVHEPSAGLVLHTARVLPSHLEEAAKKVERNLDLKPGWLNGGPTSALDLGLPNGMLDRAVKREYGPALTVRFISRYDQIHFKLYAAADQGGRHEEDLKLLKPSSAELEPAARWSMTHDVSEAYRGELKGILRVIGHGDVAERI